MKKYEEKILNIINTSHSHMTIYDIYNNLREEEPKVVLATVYNNINRLVQTGRVAKLSIEGQIDRYDKTVKHDHLICSRCGSISDFSFSDLKSRLENELGEEIEGYDLRIRYVCPACKTNKWVGCIWGGGQPKDLMKIRVKY